MDNAPCDIIKKNLQQRVQGADPASKLPRSNFKGATNDVLEQALSMEAPPYKHQNPMHVWPVMTYVLYHDMSMPQ